MKINTHRHIIANLKPTCFLFHIVLMFLDLTNMLAIGVAQGAKARKARICIISSSA